MGGVSRGGLQRAEEGRRGEFGRRISHGDHGGTERNTVALGKSGQRSCGDRGVPQLGNEESVRG